MTKKLLFLIVLIAGLAGCAAVPVESTFQLPNNGRSGLLVMTATRWGDCENMRWAYLDLRKSGVVGAFMGPYTIPFRRENRDAAGRDGKDFWLIASEAGAGEYEAGVLRTENGNLTLGGKVRIEPDKVNYLGHVDMEMGGCNRLKFVTLDNEKDDLAALYERVPAMRGVAVNKQIAIEPWSAAYRRQLEAERAARQKAK